MGIKVVLPSFSLVYQNCWFQVLARDPVPTVQLLLMHVHPGWLIFQRLYCHCMKHPRACLTNDIPPHIFTVRCWSFGFEWSHPHIPQMNLNQPAWGCVKSNPIVDRQELGNQQYMYLTKATLAGTARFIYNHAQGHTCMYTYIYI